MVAMRVYEELSRADASGGLDGDDRGGRVARSGGPSRATFDALYAGGPDAIIGGAFNPAGVAVPVEGDTG